MGLRNPTVALHFRSCLEDNERLGKCPWVNTGGGGDETKAQRATGARRSP